MNTPENPVSIEEEILAARARALARTPEEPSAGGILEVVEFLLDQERYGVETRHVHSVAPLNNLTLLPCTPAFVAGIVNLRGHIVPVIDLKKFFHLDAPGISDHHQIVRIQGRGLDFAILADFIVGVRTVRSDLLEPKLPTLAGIQADSIQGITPDRMIVLDADRILSDPRIIVDDKWDE